MDEKKFYDIHFHAMDLSHVNITAFLNRFLQEGIIGLIKIKLNTLRGWSIILCFIIMSVIMIISIPILIIPALLILIIIGVIPNSGLAKYLHNLIRKRFKLAGLILKKNKAINLLSFMESSILYDFLILEEYLKKKPVIISENNTLSIGNSVFHKIVLCYRRMLMVQ